MEAFRIHHRRYDTLDGTGAARSGGRWNPLGLPMVYAAAAFEGALLEQLVHANIGRLPPAQVASRISIPDALDVPSLDADQHEDWRREAASRRIGEEWAASGASVALVVPSFVARPWGRNVLLNPAHPDIVRVTVREVVDLIWDPRLGRYS